MEDPRARVLKDSSTRTESNVEDTIRVFAVFQPIVDLIAGVPIGFEALSRGTESSDSAEVFFRTTREQHSAWDVERACRLAAISAISELGGEASTRSFFLNVSPDVIEDPRFVEGFTLAQLRHYGIDPSRIVIEITEKTSIVNHDRFRAVVSHYTRQGFQFAIDDFGSGHSSLVALIAATPRYIKLDMHIVRDLHRDPYRRHLVRALNAFAASVDSRLVAEGVETWEELEALLRLGVRYAQGFLFGRPARTPTSLSDDVAAQLRRVVRAVNAGSGEPDETIDPLVEPAVTHNAAAVTVEQLERAFHSAPELDHVVLVDGGRPKGLVTRDFLGSKLAGPYGYAIHQWKPGERVAKRDPLVVLHGTPVTTLATLAMDRAQSDLYDPVLVVDAQGVLIGTIRVNALIRKSVELQVSNAQGANPLTGLPGNRAIHRWLQEGVAVPGLAVLYADLDRFKEYNDRYGFLMGDELIRLAARVLTRTLIAGHPDSKLGHVGGDDFVAVFPDGVEESALAAACDEFDTEKTSLFDPEDLERGNIVTKTRRGLMEEVPLVTISLAFIDCARFGGGDMHPAILSQVAASLKKKVKERTAELRRSSFIVERRSYRPSGQ